MGSNFRKIEKIKSNNEWVILIGDLNKQIQHATTLSKYVWELKRENAPYEISWKKLVKGRVFNPVTKTCQLCLKEKYLIMFSPEGATLNKRTELYSTCRHRLKLLLGNLKT
jgi:hypothetical protein